MRLFKHKQRIEENDKHKYWKDPRLDDEGTYDYYAYNKPDNKRYMCWSTCKCDECGKEPRFKRYGEAWDVYWYCYDGWDGDSGFMCWQCLLKSKLRGIKSKIKRKIKIRKEYRELIKMLKNKGVKITKDEKDLALNIVKQNNGR